MELYSFVKKVIARSRVGLVDRDLSLRQLGVFLHVYLNEETMTPKRISFDLDLDPAIASRAVIRLEEWGLVRREKVDGKSVNVCKTLDGRVYLKTLRKMGA